MFSHQDENRGSGIGASCLKPTGASPPAAAETTGGQQQDERTGNRIAPANRWQQARLPENSGCDAVNIASLPDSPPGFPASNLGSNAKGRMGKIKLFPTTEYTSKQASDPVVPLAPCAGIFLGPQDRGADQPDSGAVSRRLRKDLRLQPKR